MALAVALVDDAEELPTNMERPRRRGDCLPGGRNEERPCPFVSCRHHLYLEVSPETGSIKFNFPVGLEEIPETCSFDVADRGGITLEELGVILDRTRERARQVEVIALRRLRRWGGTLDLDDGGDR
jgi:hypothetical protein